MSGCDLTSGVIANIIKTRATLMAPPREQRRSLHQVPPLTYDETFKQKGIPGLLSSHGYTLAWTSYQTLLIHKLNELTAGEPYENSDPKDLAIQFARDPLNASLFNHASAAHNNHWFFKTLSTAPIELNKVVGLKKSLEVTFGSVETLKTTILDTAAGMFGPGFVWLVWARNLDPPLPRSTSSKGSWRILTTYLAGTPYPEAGYRQQGIDANTNNAKSYADYVNNTRPANSAGAFGAFSKAGQDRAQLPPGGTSILPVLCVNTWEHVWLRDYGISGKRSFLADWWDCVDWGAVEQIAPMEAKAPLDFSRMR
jgi:superoxide dismutase, Fe-Mn family